MNSQGGVQGLGRGVSGRGNVGSSRTGSGRGSGRGGGRGSAFASSQLRRNFSSYGGIF